MNEGVHRTIENPENEHRDFRGEAPLHYRSSWQILLKGQGTQQTVLEAAHGSLRASEPAPAPKSFPGSWRPQLGMLQTWHLLSLPRGSL